jgi:hypothetical protein
VHGLLTKLLQLPFQNDVAQLSQDVRDMELMLHLFSAEDVDGQLAIAKVISQLLIHDCMYSNACSTKTFFWLSINFEKGRTGHFRSYGLFRPSLLQ